MTKYWQVARRVTFDSHASVKDFSSEIAAELRAEQMNRDYQTDEYFVIERSSEGVVSSLGNWQNRARAAAQRIITD